MADTTVVLSNALEPAEAEQLGLQFRYYGQNEEVLVGSAIADRIRRQGYAQPEGAAAGAASSPVTRGESAYEIAVRYGFVGTEQEWLASLAGSGGSGQAAVDALLTNPDPFPQYLTPGEGDARYPTVGTVTSIVQQNIGTQIDSAVDTAIRGRYGTTLDSAASIAGTVAVVAARPVVVLTEPGDPAPDVTNALLVEDVVIPDAALRYDAEKDGTTLTAGVGFTSFTGAGASVARAMEGNESPNYLLTYAGGSVVGVFSGGSRYGTKTLPTTGSPITRLQHASHRYFVSAPAGATDLLRLLGASNTPGIGIRLDAARHVVISDGAADRWVSTWTVATGDYLAWALLVDAGAGKASARLWRNTPADPNATTETITGLAATAVTTFTAWQEGVLAAVASSVAHGPTDVVYDTDITIRPPAANGDAVHANLLRRVYTLETTVAGLSGGGGGTAAADPTVRVRRDTDAATITNSVAPVTDAVLTAAVDASSIYRVKFSLFYDASQTADATVTLSGPPGSSGYLAVDGALIDTSDYGSLSTAAARRFGTPFTLAGGGGVGTMAAVLTGELHTGPTGGTVSVAYAQATAETTSLIVRAGSYAEITKVA